MALTNEIDAQKEEQIDWAAEHTELVERVDETVKRLNVEGIYSNILEILSDANLLMISEAKELKELDVHLPTIDYHLRKEARKLGIKGLVFSALSLENVKTLARHELTKREISSERKKWIIRTALTVVIAIVGWTLWLVQYLDRAPSISN